MGQKMKNAPVYFTIAQVRFNPILSLETYLPSIQESFRKLGYEDFKPTIVATFNLAIVASGEGSSPQVPPTQRVSRYTFANMEGTRGFILEQNALSFQATDYDTFETFSGAFLEGLELLHKAVGIGYSERVGVRYLDAVYPRAGEKLSEYIVPEVMGLTSKLEHTLVHSFSETRAQTAVGTTISRTVIQDGPIGFPPDLAPHGLTVDERFTRLDGLHAIIDTDGSYDSREKFDTQSIKARLHNLHDEIWKSFKATVTRHSLSVWN